MILKSKREEQETETRALRQDGDDGQRPASWRSLLGLKQTWGIILGRSLTDPVWFFITDWFAIYLVSKGFKLENTLIGFWVPFLAADCGNFFGGVLVTHSRGWPVLRAESHYPHLQIGMAFDRVFVSKFPLIAVRDLDSLCRLVTWLFIAVGPLSSSTVASVSGMSGIGRHRTIISMP
jgi:ACS family hexuronate transporter-like MFS transporter